MIDTDKLEVERTLSVERPQGIGTAPVQRERHARRLPPALADSGEDAIAVFALSAKRSCDPAARGRQRGRRAPAATRPARESRRAAAVAGEEAEEEGAPTTRCAAGQALAAARADPGRAPIRPRR